MYKDMNMKYIWILLLSLLLSCEYYDDFFDGAKILPIGSESLLITNSFDDIQSVFLENGFTIFNTKKGYETGIRLIKNVGYFKCEFKNIVGGNTQIKILYSYDEPDYMEYLKYNDDSTRIIFNRVITILNNNGLSDIYYEE
jgi:hypothetical protein